MSEGIQNEMNPFAGEEEGKNTVQNNPLNSLNTNIIFNVIDYLRRDSPLVWSWFDRTESWFCTTALSCSGCRRPLPDSSWPAPDQSHARPGTDESKGERAITINKFTIIILRYSITYKSVE